MKIGVVIRLQTLQAHRRLELPYSKVGFRKIIQLHVRFKEDHRALAEIRTDVVIDVFKDRSGNGRPDAAEQNLIHQRDRALAEKGAVVHLKVSSKTDRKIAVAGGNGESGAVVGSYGRCGFGFGGGCLILKLFFLDVMEAFSA